MADLNKVVADRSANLVHAGTFGNKTTVPLSYTAAAGQIADVIVFGKLPAGFKITDARIVFGALGASSTIKFGYRKVDANGTLTDDDDYFVGATSTASAGGARLLATAFPVDVTEDVYVIGTIAGGAVTGRVDIVVDGIYVGK